mmetsp:Transcript_7629/g.12489  ORF Transcript_7629/g.12489 Transcript_7629/m.12489 type:complete len:251 (-) Transcript_7629:168-920(-)
MNSLENQPPARANHSGEASTSTSTSTSTYPSSSPSISFVAEHAANSHMVGDRHEHTTNDEKDVEKVQNTIAVARLSLLAMQHCAANKSQIMSKILGCNVIHILYKAMFRYPRHTELQREIKETLSALQNYLDESIQSQHVHTDSTKHTEATSTPSNVAVIPTIRKRNAKHTFIRYHASCDMYKHECNLRSHCKIHTEHAFCCQFCGKKFGRKSNWMEHTRTHTGERPFKCAVCQKGFKQQYTLKKHMKGH